MLFISDVSGVLTPLIEEDLGLVQPQQQVQSTGSDQPPLERSEDTVAATNTPLDSQKSLDPGSPAVGTAGAAALYHKDEESKRNSAVLSRNAVLSRYLHDVLPPTAAHEMEQDSPSHTEVVDHEDRELASQQSQNRYEVSEDPAPVPKKPAVVASQIMSSPVITLHARDLVRHAQVLFSTNDFRYLPVVSEQNKVIGIFSVRDLERNPDVSQFVATVMTTNVLTARPDTEIRDIAKVILRRRVGSVPIIDAEGVLVGIITRSDILRAMVTHPSVELWV